MPQLYNPSTGYVAPVSYSTNVSMMQVLVATDQKDPRALLTSTYINATKTYEVYLSSVSKTDSDGAQILAFITFMLNQGTVKFMNMIEPVAHGLLSSSISDTMNSKYSYRLDAVINNLNGTTTKLGINGLNSINVHLGNTLVNEADVLTAKYNP